MRIFNNDIFLTVQFKAFIKGHYCSCLPNHYFVVKLNMLREIKSTPYLKIITEKSVKKLEKKSKRQEKG